MCEIEAAVVFWLWILVLEYSFYYLSILSYRCKYKSISLNLKRIL